MESALKQQLFSFGSQVQINSSKDQVLQKVKPVVLPTPELF
jgi:hypothetical protein